MNQIENIDYEYSNALNIASFNPLDRGNLNQIRHGISLTEMNELVKGFNPLDRGNLNQIPQSSMHAAKIGEYVSIP